MSDNTNVPLTYSEAWDARPDGRSQEVIFLSIMEGIKERSGGNLTNEDANIAARHLISFCRELIGLKQEETIGYIDPSILSAMNRNEH